MGHSALSLSCSAEGGGQWQRGLTSAPSEDALVRIIGLREKVPGLLRHVAGQSDPGRAGPQGNGRYCGCAAEARKLDPTLAMAWVSESTTRAVQAKVLMDLGRESHLTEALTIAFQTTQQFADLPDAHLACRRADVFG